MERGGSDVGLSKEKLDSTSTCYPGVEDAGRTGVKHSHWLKVSKEEEPTWEAARASRAFLIW